jgi:hypothetical protein
MREAYYLHLDQVADRDNKHPGTHQAEEVGLQNKPSDLGQ